jgi:hypothetical protein
MTEMRKLKDDESKVARREARQKQKQVREAAGPMDKVFADLSNAEKDELLKRLAILAGLVEE